jgi:hypothetical protein
MENPINKIKQYASNVNKELGQLQAASEKSVKAKNDANIQKLPNGKTIKTGLSEAEADANTRKQRSEFFGAVLQNRTYVDRKTGRAR